MRRTHNVRYQALNPRALGETKVRSTGDPLPVGEPVKGRATQPWGYWLAEESATANLLPYSRDDDFAHPACLWKTLRYLSGRVSRNLMPFS